MTKLGIIEPYDSPYASPVVLYMKKNGKPAENPEARRFTIDYPKLNAQTKYLIYPMPRNEELLHKF